MGREWVRRWVRDREAAATLTVDKHNATASAAQAMRRMDGRGCIGSGEPVICPYCIGRYHEFTRFVAEVHGFSAYDCGLSVGVGFGESS